MQASSTSSIWLQRHFGADFVWRGSLVWTSQLAAFCSDWHHSSGGPSSDGSAGEAGSSDAIRTASSMAARMEPSLALLVPAMLKAVP